MKLSTQIDKSNQQEFWENLDYMFCVKNGNFTTKVKFTKLDYLI